MLPEIKSYIEKFPEETQARLIELNNLILEEAPDAAQSISYGMPASKKGNVAIQTRKRVCSISIKRTHAV